MIRKVLHCCADYRSALDYSTLPLKTVQYILRTDTIDYKINPSERHMPPVVVTFGNRVLIKSIVLS